jgi:hypothetical protein
VSEGRSREKIEKVGMVQKRGRADGVRGGGGREKSVKTVLVFRVRDSRCSPAIYIYMHEYITIYIHCTSMARNRHSAKECRGIYLQSGIYAHINLSLHIKHLCGGCGGLCVCVCVCLYLITDIPTVYLIIFRS